MWIIVDNVPMWKMVDGMECLSVCVLWEPHCNFAFTLVEFSRKYKMWQSQRQNMKIWDQLEIWNMTNLHIWSMISSCFHQTVREATRSSVGACPPSPAYLPTDQCSSQIPFKFLSDFHPMVESTAHWEKTLRGVRCQSFAQCWGFWKRSSIFLELGETVARVWLPAFEKQCLT